MPNIDSISFQNYYYLVKNLCNVRWKRKNLETYIYTSWHINNIWLKIGHRPTVTSCIRGNWFHLPCKYYKNYHLNHKELKTNVTICWNNRINICKSDKFDAKCFGPQSRTFQWRSAKILKILYLFCSKQLRIWYAT